MSFEEAKSTEGSVGFRGFRPVVSIPQQARGRLWLIATASLQPLATHMLPSLTCIVHAPSVQHVSLILHISLRAKARFSSTTSRRALKRKCCHTSRLSYRKPKEERKEKQETVWSWADLRTQTCKPETQLAAQLSPAPMASLETS